MILAFDQFAQREYVIGNARFHCRGDAERLMDESGCGETAVMVSPHLTDLQPSDQWQAFQYLSLALEVRLFATGPVQALGLGYLELYGSVEHEDTIVTLKPGQWIRVKAKLKLHTWPSQPVEAQLSGDFWLHKNVHKPHEGGAFTESVNVYGDISTVELGYFNFFFVGTAFCFDLECLFQ